jgi:plasmid maintenance system antidote protein VapI
MKPENRRPTSPAEMLREEFGITDVERVTAANVVEIAKRTGASVQFWLSLQQNHDEWRPPGSVE